VSLVLWTYHDAGQQNIKDVEDCLIIFQKALGSNAEAAVLAKILLDFPQAIQILD
jgi:hypothetical protein